MILSKIIKTFTQIAEIFTEELKNIFRDSGVVVIFFAAGLIYPVLYSYIYKNEIYRELPIAIVNDNPSSFSRNFINKIDATPDIKVKYKVENMETAKILYSKGKVNGIIFIPSEFSSNILSGKQTTVSAYCNMSSMMYYRTLYTGFNSVCLEMGQDIQIKNLTESGLTEHQAIVMAKPVLNEPHALYNPKGGFASFLLPAVLVMIIQQTLVLGIGMLAATAREENTFHQLIPYQKKYHGTMRIISGKGLAYLVLYSFISIYDLLLIPSLFNLPHYLNLSTIIPFLLPYLLACIFFSMAISVFFWNREMSLLLFLCTSVPLLFLTGFTWPSYQVNGFWKVLSYFFPSTFGVNAFIKMNSMGASLTQVSNEVFAMWIQAGVYFIIAWFVYRWQIKQSEKKINRAG
jgi:ABC-2 type transport system permease protein